MNNSKWIDELENQMELHPIVLLYGNIHDLFFYENESVTLDDYIKERFNIIDSYFTLDEMKNENCNNSGTNCDINSSRLSLNPTDPLINLNHIRKELEKTKNENNSNLRNLIYIKNSYLFFPDYQLRITSGNIQGPITHSLQ